MAKMYTGFAMLSPAAILKGGLAALHPLSLAVKAVFGAQNWGTAASSTRVITNQMLRLLIRIFQKIMYSQTSCRLWT